MRRVVIGLLLTAHLAFAGASQSDTERASSNAAGDRLPLRVMYVGTLDSPRGKAFVSFLGRHFATVRTAPLDRQKPVRPRDVDVVLLDRPADPAEDYDAQKPRPSPLGHREAWELPLVLLGGAVPTHTARWALKGHWG